MPCGRSGRGLHGDEVALGFGSSPARERFAQPRFDSLGALQALGGAGQYQPDVAGAEAACVGREIEAGGPLSKCGGKFLAVIHKPADKTPQP
jgi:hypothetical protein